MTEPRKLSERLIERLGKYDCSITRFEVTEIEALEGEVQRLQAALIIANANREGAESEVKRLELHISNLVESNKKTQELLMSKQITLSEARKLVEKWRKDYLFLDNVGLCADELERVLDSPSCTKGD